MIKGYTDIEQSQTLAKILPLESADMKWYFWKSEIDAPKLPTFGYGKEATETCKGTEAVYLPCWSVGALLGVLPFELIVDNQLYLFDMIKGFDKNGETYAIKYAIFNTTLYLHLTDFYNNPVDACYEMIVKLKEKNLL